MHRSVVPVLIVVGLLASGVVVSVAALPLDPGSADSSAPDSELASPAVNSSVQTAAQEFDQTTFDITVYENGSARWTFEYERVLQDDQEVSEFETYAERFESEETDLYTKFTDQATALVSSGKEYTDREMAATNFNRTARVERTINTVGVVRMSFTWEGFAATEGNEVVVSDVFDGTFYLMNDQTLTIRAGDGLEFDRVRPDPEYDSPELHERDRVVWRGEREFIDGHPYVAFVPAGQAGPSGIFGGLSPGAVRVGGALLAIGLFGAGAYLAYRWDVWPFPMERSPESTSGPSASGGDSQSSATASDAVGISDADLMTDEDRVTALLSENGGRMKQVQIVEETDWSKSKVSMLLSEMESEGTISKLRVGRENIISLDGFEPEAAKSPHETESQ